MLNSVFLVHLRSVLLMGCFFAMSGCASVKGVNTSALDGRAVEHAVSGHGTPVVVFENGLGGRLQWWAKVLPDVAQETTVFAYNRAGTGGSADVATSRHGDVIVEELRRNLCDVGLAPPYVLVGHSLGGLYMQLYARRYPSEVAGMVLVDSTHPAQLTGAGAKDNWPTLLKWAMDVALSGAAKQELEALPATGAALLELPPVTDKPVIVLSAQKPMSETSDMARDANAKRVDIARLNPGAKQIWVDSGHVIPLEKPEAVIAAVREVLASGRAAGAPVSSTAGDELRHLTH